MSPSVWGQPGNRCVRHPQPVVPSIPKMKERFRAPITHLRDNISRSIESDVRDFGGSSHLPYDGLRLLRGKESKLAGAALVVRVRSEPSHSARRQSRPPVYTTLR